MIQEVGCGGVGVDGVDSSGWLWWTGSGSGSGDGGGSGVRVAAAALACNVDVKVLLIMIIIIVMIIMTIILYTQGRLISIIFVLFDGPAIRIIPAIAGSNFHLG